ncbi:MAG: hypothetical protein ACK40G_03560 [Cytophagaceae bacterium]
MENRTLNIISFDVPSPPDYGGVIDVYYKIKALKAAGIKIILHAFSKGRNVDHNLESICEEIFIYKRKEGLSSVLSTIPYIVKSRSDKDLINNLNKNPYPILFEGLHSCYLLNHPSLSSRKKIVRMHNIEPHYYWNLFKSAKDLKEKIFFYTESAKLYVFEKNLAAADYILTISKQENEYYKKVFPSKKLITVNPFSDFNFRCKPGVGKYLLYHGNLSVPENIRSIEYLLPNLTEISFPLIITGKDPTDQFKKFCSKFPFAELIPDPDQETLYRLIENAHIHLLYSVPGTGVKLKLINSLLWGRHCLSDALTAQQTGIPEALEISDGDISKKISELMTIPFTEEMINKRKDLMKDLDPEIGAAKILKLL